MDSDQDLSPGKVMLQGSRRAKWVLRLLTGVLLVGLPAWAGEVELVSKLDPIHESDTQSHTGSLFGGSPCLSMSGDGRYTVFSSDANNLVIGQVDTNLGQDVFLYDRVSGLTNLVSHVEDVSTKAGSGTSGLCTISADGSVVALTSTSPELSPDSSEAGAFLYERATGTLTLAAPFQSHGGIQALSLSADGRFLAFSSSWNYPDFTDSSGDVDVFVYDRSTGTTTLVSHADGASTTVANQGSFQSRISADGRFVAFSSRASNLLSGMSGSTQNVFLYELATGTVTLVSHASSSPGTGGDADSGTAAVSADGSYVLFSSTAGNLVAGMTDANGSATPDLFLYEHASGTVTLVDHAAGSATATANSGNGFYPPGLSADGRYVVFSSSATDLVAGQVDTNGSFDVFLYDRVPGTSSLVSRQAGSPTTAQGGAHTGMSADGGTVSFLGVGGLFLFDRVTGVRVLVNHAGGSPLTPANSGAGGDASGRTPVSADGRFVSYLSAATDLVTGIRDLNQDADVFVFDRDTAVNAIASASPPSMTRKTPLGTSEAKAISADGRFTVFVSTSRQLLPGPQSGNSSQNVFLRDRLAGTTTLVSRSSAGAYTAGNDESDLPAISADGRFIAFVSRATDLVPGTTDNNSVEDVFVYDRLTGATSLVSRTAANPATTGNGGPTFPFLVSPVLSADGRYVLYLSRATNLVQGQIDTNGADDLFLYDRQTGSTTLVSHATGSPTQAGDSWSFYGVLSVDSRFIAFISGAGNLVPGQSGFHGNLFLFDRLSGAVTLVSHEAGSPSTGGNGDSNLPELSADGRYLSFISEAYNLVPGQVGGTSRNVYLYDHATGTTVLISHAHSSASLSADNESYVAPISADGRFIAFRSAADNLIPGQAPTDPAQIFLYDHLAGTTTLAVEAPPATEDFAGVLGPGLKISADGRFIAFTQALDYEKGGIFLYDRLSGSITLASHTPSAPDTAGNGASFLSSISARGDFVAFTSSSTDLVAGDFNDATDAFLYINPLPDGRDFHTLTPCRVLDTRQPQDGPALVSGQAEILSLHGICGIPATAKAVAVNITVTQPTGAGHLSFAPGDLGDPAASTINFSPGQTRANNAILPLALNGTGTLRVSPAVTGNGSVHVILDVVGYFE